MTCMGRVIFDELNNQLVRSNRDTACDVQYQV